MGVKWRSLSAFFRDRFTNRLTLLSPLGAHSATSVFSGLARMDALWPLLPLSLRKALLDSLPPPSAVTEQQLANIVHALGSMEAELQLYEDSRSKSTTTTVSVTSPGWDGDISFFSAQREISLLGSSSDATSSSRRIASRVLPKFTWRLLQSIVAVAPQLTPQVLNTDMQPVNYETC